MQSPGAASTTTVRKFLIPKLNVKAKAFHKMVNLDLQGLEEPPLTRHLSDGEVEDIRINPLKLDHPCHNQGVERHIKLVTEASSSVATFDRRDGMIRQRIRSRKLMKMFESKKQFTM